MTLEELFMEEYKALKKDNEELKSLILRLRKDLDFENNRDAEFCSFFSSLNLSIQKSDYTGKKFISINIPIFEGNEYYKLISKFAKEDEIKKEEDE